MAAITAGAKQAAATARHRSVFVRPADFPLRDVRQTIALTQQVVQQAARKGSDASHDASRGVRGLVAMHFPRDPETMRLLGYGGITLASSQSPILAPEPIFLDLKIPLPNSAKIRDHEPEADGGEDAEIEGKTSEDGRTIMRGSVRIPPLHRARLADVAPYLGNQSSIADVPVEEVEVKISPRTTDPPARRNKRRGPRFDGFFAKATEKTVSQAEDQL